MKAGCDMGDSVSHIVIGQAILVIHVGADFKILLRGIEILPQLQIRVVARPLVGKMVRQKGFIGLYNRYPVEMVVLSDTG